MHKNLKKLTYRRCLNHQILKQFLEEKLNASLFFESICTDLQRQGT